MTVFALVAGALSLVALGAWLGWWYVSLPNPWVGFGLAVSTGVLLSGAVWLMIGSRTERELRALNRYVEANRRVNLSRDDYTPAGWLKHTHENLNETFDLLREMVARLNAERRELEIQVRVVDAERQHAEAILQSISDAVLVTDAFNEVAIANEAAAVALDFDLTGARHQPVDQVVADRALVHLIRDARESGNLANRVHFEHMVAHSERKTVYDVSVSCVANRQDEVAGVVTILHDVTKEKEISEMKNEFVSSVSHELRTPLSSIKAYIEMLVDGEADDEQTRREFYNIIQSETNRLSRLIDNILNISRIESGIQKVQREHIVLLDVVRDVIEVMRPQARAKQIELNDKTNENGHRVYADRDMIYQAIVNLVGNAIKYTPERGRITIDMDIDERLNEVRLHVRDTGVGIPAEAVPHLFEKFYRVSDHKSMAKGTGLGLNLVKQVLETVHGGRVCVDSEHGRGSTFTIYLPLSKSTGNSSGNGKQL